jgi:hypothetical protein
VWNYEKYVFKCPGMDYPGSTEGRHGLPPVYPYCAEMDNTNANDRKSLVIMMEFEIPLTKLSLRRYGRQTSEILSIWLLERELKLCQVLSACLFIATVNLDLKQQTLNCRHDLSCIQVECTIQRL